MHLLFHIVLKFSGKITRTDFICNAVVGPGWQSVTWRRGGSPCGLALWPDPQKVELVYNIIGYVIATGNDFAARNRNRLPISYPVAHNPARVAPISYARP